MSCFGSKSLEFCNAWALTLGAIPVEAYRPCPNHPSGNLQKTLLFCLDRNQRTAADLPSSKARLRDDSPALQALWVRSDVQSNVPAGAKLRQAHHPINGPSTADKVSAGLVSATQKIIALTILGKHCRIFISPR
jgi:hypothetical protein